MLLYWVRPFQQKVLQQDDKIERYWGRAKVTASSLARNKPVQTEIHYVDHGQHVDIKRNWWLHGLIVLLHRDCLYCLPFTTICQERGRGVPQHQRVSCLSKFGIFQTCWSFIPWWMTLRNRLHPGFHAQLAPREIMRILLLSHQPVPLFFNGWRSRSTSSNKSTLDSNNYNSSL